MMSSSELVPMRAQRQHLTGERLLQSAVELFYLGRFESASLDEIAGRAGYPRGATGAHFPSKADLAAAVLDEVYRGVIERLGRVRVDTADQLISVVSTWAFLAATRSDWIPLEFPLEFPLTAAAPERAIPLTQLVTVLGDWLAAAAERIGGLSTDCGVTVTLLVLVLAGLGTQHPDPTGITLALMRRYVELALFDIVGPRTALVGPHIVFRTDRGLR